MIIRTFILHLMIKTIIVPMVETTTVPMVKTIGYNVGRRDATCTWDVRMSKSHTVCHRLKPVATMSVIAMRLVRAYIKIT
jgi:hypothetical protein